jgi:hypothetical protein
LNVGCNEGLDRHAALDRITALLVAPLLLAWNTVVVSIHFDAWAVAEKKRGLFA